MLRYWSKSGLSNLPLLGQSLKVPLWLLLAVPFTTQIVAVVGLTGYISWRHGQKAVNQLAIQLQMEASNRVSQHLDTLLSTPHQSNELSAIAIQNNLLDPNDLEKFGQYLQAQIRVNPTFSYINFGHATGEFIGAGYGEDGTLYIDITDSDHLGSYREYRVDEAGNPTELLFEEPYDHLTDDWYTDAVAAGEPLWSHVYTWETPPAVAISASYPVYDAQQQLIGVMGVDYLLNHLGDFLEKIEVSPSAQLFLLDREGQLIAASHADEVRIAEDGSAHPIQALASDNPVVKAIAQQLLKHHDQFIQIADHNHLQMAIDGEPTFVHIDSWQGPLGLDWLIVTAIPERDFMGQIHANARNTLILCLLATVGAAGLAALMARRLTAPLLQFGQAASAIAKGGFDRSLRSHQMPIGIQELDMLDTAFNQMVNRLQASFAALEAANTNLETRVQQRTAELELTHQIASQIRNSLEVETILATAVERIQQLLQIDRCTFGWYLPTASIPGWEVTTEARRPDVSTVVGTYPIEAVGPLSTALVSQEVIRIDDVAEMPEPILRELLLSLDCVSFLALPLTTQSGKIGAVVCSHTTDLRPWQDEEVALVTGVINQLAIALNQAELYHQARENALQAQTQAQELSEALQNLTQAQAQLVQTEKMSSLGQLVAGVAHEINNPVNFIYGNVSHAQEYAQDLLNLVDLYQVTYPTASPEIEDEITAIDLEFLKTDLTKLLNSMKLDADRIREIVTSLRTFSRLDEAEFKAVDIHEGIESTLMILHNRLKAKPEHPAIEVIKQYAELPKIECFPGQLNQVFMNLLTNAIDALEETSQGRTFADMAATPSQIKIRTEVLQNNWIAIHISDNGAGIPPAVLDRLFDPFFTTKTVGKGTGLGLSISHQIITEKHKGHLRCQSVLGQWTEFTVEIPIRQAAAIAVA